MVAGALSLALAGLLATSALAAPAPPQPGPPTPPGKPTPPGPPAKPTPPQAPGGPIGPGRPAGPKGQSPKSFASLAAKQKGRYFGVAALSPYFTQYNQYNQIYLAEFDQITPENEMKWEAIEPTQGNFDFAGTDALVAKVKEVNGVMRGHNFCWDSQTPSYVTSITDPTQLKAVLKKHIDTVMARYKNDMYAIDVVNEPLNEDGTYKSNVWYNVLGEDYIELALNYTHAAAPNVKLYINDYNIESVNAKSQSMAAISKKLLAKGAPLHGIGFESHFIGGLTPKDLPQSMNQFTNQGLQVAITELDIRIPVNSNGTASAADLATQASEYAFVVQSCLQNDLCPGVTVWEISDNVSWIPGVFAGYGAALLYDQNFQPKPAVQTVRDALSKGK